MKNKFLIRAILTVAIFLGYSNIWGAEPHLLREPRPERMERPIEPIRAVEHEALKPLEVHPVHQIAAPEQHLAEKARTPEYQQEERPVAEAKTPAEERVQERLAEQAKAQPTSTAPKSETPKPETQPGTAQPATTTSHAPAVAAVKPSFKPLEVKEGKPLGEATKLPAELTPIRESAVNVGEAFKQATDMLKTANKEQLETEAARRTSTTTTVEEQKQIPVIIEEQKVKQASSLKPAELPAEETRIRDKALKVNEAVSKLLEPQQLEAAKPPITVQVPKEKTPTGTIEPVLAAGHNVVESLNELTKALKSTETPKEQSQSFLEKNKKLLIAGGAIGAGLLALGGILGAILGATLNKDSGQTAAQTDIVPSPTPSPTPIPSPIPNIQPDSGVVIPSPYPPAPQDDPDHQQVVANVASFYTDIEEKFAKALEESNYSDQKFVIEGEAKIGDSTETIRLEYDFVKGDAGELGSPFTPFLVTMIPQGINGIALNSDEIKNLLPDGPARELFATLIQPTAGFIFMIKIILLVNTTLRDNSKKDVEKINFIIDEATKLYSRLILTPTQDPTPDILISKMPEKFQQIIGAISLKIYGDLVYNVSDPEDTVLIKQIGEAQKLKDYLKITKFIKEKITPAIKKDMTHTEKHILIYSLQKHLSECPPKTGRDLWLHLDQLISMLTDVKKSMVKAKIDKTTVAKIETLLKKVKDVRDGKEEITVLTKKPEFEISTKIYSKNVSLNDVLKILFKNFSKIYYAKIKGDKGYLYSNVLLGKNATKYALQSIFFRCLSETLQANQILSAAKGSVTLRMADGKDSAINPDQEFSKICNKSSLKLIQAQTNLTNTILKLKADPSNAQLEDAYEKAMTDINDASKSLVADQIKFRCMFAVYLPVAQDDKSTQTPAELIKKRLADLRKNSKYVDSIIASEYESFSDALGFSPEFLGIKAK